MSEPHHPAIPYDQKASWPAFPPEGWRLIKSWGDGWGLAGPNGLRVLIDADMKDDGCPWLHVSVSRKSWLPTWDDLKTVKDAFIGPDREAIIVLPRTEEYVNIHPYCHHLWHIIGQRILPDFAEEIAGVKSI